MDRSGSNKNLATAPHNTATDPIATPRRGWSLLNMIREASNVGVSGALPGPASAPGESPQHRNSSNHSAPFDEEEDLSPTVGDRNEVLMQLANAKVSLAQVEGKLAEARRDLSRMRELNSALNTRIQSLTAERDKSWQDVCTSPDLSGVLCHSTIIQQFTHCIGNPCIRHNLICRKKSHPH